MPRLQPDTLNNICAGTPRVSGSLSKLSCQVNCYVSAGKSICVENCPAVTCGSLCLERGLGWGGDVSAGTSVLAGKDRGWSVGTCDRSDIYP